MKYYTFPEKRITKIGFFAFFFLLIFFTRSAMPATHLIGVNTAQFVQLGLICLLGTAFLIVQRQNLKAIICDKRMAVIVISSVIMILPMLIKRDWQLMYFTVLLGLLFAFFLSYFLSGREVAKYYVLIMSVLAAYSLFALCVLKPLAMNGILPVAKRNYVEWYDYYYFGLAFTVELPSYFRLYGIFREPGLYQFFLIVAIYLNTFTVDRKSETEKWCINILLAAATMLTFSTNGVLELVLFAVVLFFDKQYYKNKKLRILAYLCVLCAGIVIIIAYARGGALYKLLNQMITKVFTKTKSSSARFDSILANLQMFFQHPLFGDTFANVLHAVDHNTCSTLILYAAYGVVGGTLNVLAWLAFVWEKDRKLWANLAYSLIIFMSFNTQNLTWDIMFWLFPMMALTEKIVPWLEVKHAKK